MTQMARIIEYKDALIRIYRILRMTRIKNNTDRKMRLIIYIINKTNKTNLSYRHNVRTLKNSHQN